MNWGRTKVRLGRYRTELRLSARMTIAAVLAYAITEALNLPEGHWAVFTAVIVMQASAGGSIKAGIEWFLGTLSGGVFGAAVAVLAPHNTEFSLGMVVAVAVGPLALLAAFYPSLRVAPVTAIIVLLGAIGQPGGPIAAASTRILEIAVGSIVAIFVALFVFPSRGYRMVTEAANQTLNMIADAVPVFLEGFTGKADATGIFDRHEQIREAMAKLEAVSDEAKHERDSHLSRAPDSEPIPRTLWRMRSDFVIVSRASVQPFPRALEDRLTPSVTMVREAMVTFLRASGAALKARREAPSIAPLEQALDAFKAALETARREGLTLPLPADAVGSIFALSFALDQLRRNCGDLASRITEYAKKK